MAEPTEHTEHVVSEDEGISAIAERYGHFAPTIWDDPKNSEIRKLRSDGDILVPGDVLWISPLSEGSVSVPTGARHRFRRRGVPPKLRLQLLRNGEPRADEPFEIAIGGKTIQGRTDAEGRIDVFVPATSTEGTIHVGGEEIRIRANALRPVDTDEGLVQRLRNLGFLGREDPDDDPEALAAAIGAFQEREEIDVTGEADDATRERLRAVHDDSFGSG